MTFRQNDGNPLFNKLDRSVHLTDISCKSDTMGSEFKKDVNSINGGWTVGPTRRVSFQRHFCRGLRRGVKYSSHLSGRAGVLVDSVYWEIEHL